MSELWIIQIVRDIKVRHREAAEQARREGDRRKLLQEKAPIFWRDLTDFLRQFLLEIQGGLRGDITEGVFSFALDTDNTVIMFEKSAFPFVVFSATPEFESGRVRMTFTQHAPIGTEPACGTPIPCRFEIHSDGNIILQLNGHAYAEPEEAAKFIIQRAFTL
jgi:hypothetical protein